MRAHTHGCVGLSLSVQPRLLAAAGRRASAVVPHLLSSNGPGPLSTVLRNRCDPRFRIS